MQAAKHRCVKPSLTLLHELIQGYIGNPIETKGRAHSLLSTHRPDMVFIL